MICFVLQSRSNGDTEAGADVWFTVFYFDKAMLELMCFVCLCVCVCVLYHNFGFGTIPERNTSVSILNRYHR